MSSSMPSFLSLDISFHITPTLKLYSMTKYNVNAPTHFHQDVSQWKNDDAYNMKLAVLRHYCITVHVVKLANIVHFMSHVIRVLWSWQRCCTGQNMSDFPHLLVRESASVLFPKNHVVLSDVAKGRVGFYVVHERGYNGANNQISWSQWQWRIQRWGQ